MPDYDVITVGGGLGGAALAKVMAEQGTRVLVVEREHQFKDRIRGEFLAPWGGTEMQQLGLYGSLLETCAKPPTFSGFARFSSPGPSHHDSSQNSGARLLPSDDAGRDLGSCNWCWRRSLAWS